jgi:hypothetical protein
MSDRPNPLAKVASTVGTAWAVVSGFVSALVTFGVLSQAQDAAITAAGAQLPGYLVGLGTAIAGISGVASGLISAFRTAAHGKDEVTPVASPRDNAGNVLVPRA